MDKIYSRPRLLIPKIHISIFNKYSNNGNFKQFNDKKIMKKILRILFVLLIAFITMLKMLDAINEIVDKQCKTQAKSIATKISNEQASLVMAKYRYDDLFNVTKDTNRKCFHDKCKCNNSKWYNFGYSGENTRGNK